MKYRRVEVRWQDAHGSMAWVHPSDVDRSLADVRTLGWLLYEDDDVVVVAQDTAKDGSVCGVSVIPRVNVVKVKRL